MGDTTKKVDRTHRRGSMTVEEWRHEHQKKTKALEQAPGTRNIRSNQNIGTISKAKTGDRKWRD